MELVFYLLAALGSSSLGYSLLRTGFPNTQKLEKLNKILYGYALGLVVVIPAIVTGLTFGAGGFFLLFGLIYFLIFIILFAKRISYGEEDTVKLIKEEKKELIIPKRVLTKEEKETKTNISSVAKVLTQEPIVAPKKIKEQIFKEKRPNVIDQLRVKTTQIEHDREKEEKEEKEEALNKMKLFAKQIDKNKQKKKTKKNANEIDEDELSSLGEGF